MTDKTAMHPIYVSANKTLRRTSFANIEELVDVPLMYCGNIMYR